MGDKDKDKAEPLGSRIQNEALDWPPEGNTQFIPKSKIKELLTLRNIRLELADIFEPKDTRLDHFAQEIFASRKKLFAILLWGQFSQEMRRLSIEKLMENKITDKHLPFHRINVHGQPLELCSNGAKCTTKTGTRDECVTLTTVMGHWTPRDKRDFSGYQWFVLAPTFKGKKGDVPHFDFEKNTIMPFREDFEGDAVQMKIGGYSRVWPIRIVAGHQSIYTPKNESPEPLLAVKQLSEVDEQAFKSETDMLKLLTKVKHKHLVELLATYRFNNKYHLLFPYAAANLRTFWAAVPSPYWNAITYLWVLDQLTGLASALTAIHMYQDNPAYTVQNGNPGGFSRFKTGGMQGVKVARGEEQFGRHGDVKPDNLLWRKTGKSLGILIITDLGLSQFNHKHSRSVVNPAGLGGSQTYIPPELLLLTPISRAFDIWGLGAVYLEFITWLLTGVKGLEAFHEVRFNPTMETGVEDDAYFTISMDDRTKRAEVRPAVVECIRTLRQHPQCSRMILDVLDIVERLMLVIEPHDRISAEELHRSLRDLHKRAEQSQNCEYLVGKHPLDEGKGFQSPDFAV